MARYDAAALGAKHLDCGEFARSLAEASIRQVWPLALHTCDLYDAARFCFFAGTRSAAIKALKDVEVQEVVWENARNNNWVGVINTVDALHSLEATAEAAAATAEAARNADLALQSPTYASVAAAWVALSAGWTAKAAGKGDEVLTLAATLAAEILEKMVSKRPPVILL